MVRDGVANIVHGLQQRGFDPRKVGTDSWESRCPAHGSADHALSITRDGSNHVVLECRSAQRCQFDRILHALRLGYDTLYDETPDSLIRRLSGVPIHPALSESSQAHEKNDAGPSAVEAANVPAQTVLPTERSADAEALKAASSPEPAGPLLEFRLEAATEAKIPPSGYPLEPRSNECRLSLRERTFFRGAKDSHMGVGRTAFDQPGCVPSSVTPQVVAFCILNGWRPLPARGHLCRVRDHVSPYWNVRGVTPHSLIRRW